MSQIPRRTRSSTRATTSRTATALAVAFVAGLAVQPASAERMLFVISDLHLGVGRDASTGAWDAFEDFRWHDEFVLFLDKLDEVTGGQADLVLNGDSFELWQSLGGDCPTIEGNADLGCSEAELRARLARAIDQHRLTLQALRAFEEKNENRVVLVPGNHDAGLLFDSAEADLRQVIGDDVLIPKTGDWIWNDKVYMEHGHEIGRDVNVMKDWPKPFVRENGTTYLVRSWGEQFVQDVFDRYERRYPIVDNISGHEAGIEYMVDQEGAAGTAAGVGRFLHFFFVRTSWDQFKTGLGEGDKVPPWDFEATRAQGPGLLLAMLPPDARWGDAIRAASAQGGLANSMEGFTDEELRGLCDTQWARHLDAGDGRIRNCSPADGDLGAVFGSFLDPDKVMADHLDKRRQELSERYGDAWDGRFDTFIYSHTHKAERISRPVARNLGGSWDPAVVNTGAWQRVVSESHLEMLRQPGQEDLVSFSHTPEDLAPCYSVVLVKEQKTQEPKLLFWTWESQGGWNLRERCTQDPGITP